MHLKFYLCFINRSKIKMNFLQGKRSSSLWAIVEPKPPETSDCVWYAKKKA